MSDNGPCFDCYRNYCNPCQCDPDDELTDEEMGELIDLDLDGD